MISARTAALSFDSSRSFIPYVVGIVLSLGVALFARRLRLDRDRRFTHGADCDCVYYVLFAAISESVHTVLSESIVMAGFSIAAVVGFKSSGWIVVGGLAGHGVFDALHGTLLSRL